MSFESSLVWLQPGFLCFGEKPGLWRALQDDLDFLKQVSVRAILSLVEREPELEAYSQYGFVTRHVPLIDNQAPSTDQLNRCMQALTELEASDIPVYMHCYAGFGRSGTIAAGWLIRQGTKPLEAIERVRKLRPGAIECDAQYNLLLGSSAGELF